MLLRMTSLTVMAWWQMKLSIAELAHNPIEFVGCPDISLGQSKIIVIERDARLFRRHDISWRYGRSGYCWENGMSQRISLFRMKITCGE